MPAPELVYNMMMVCAAILIIPCLIDFSAASIDKPKSGELDGIVAPIWYPFSGLILSALFLWGSFKGKKEPGSTTCILTVGMVFGIINIIVVAWFGFVGVVMSTVCAAASEPTPDVDWNDAGEPTTTTSIKPMDAGVKDFCDMMTLLTLSAFLRFVVTLVLLVSSCMGVCCLNTGAVAVQPVVMMAPMQGQPAMVVVAQPAMVVKTQAAP